MMKGAAHLLHHVLRFFHPDCTCHRVPRKSRCMPLPCEPSRQHWKRGPARGCASYAECGRRKTTKRVETAQLLAKAQAKAVMQRRHAIMQRKRETIAKHAWRHSDSCALLYAECRRTSRGSNTSLRMMRCDKQCNRLWSSIESRPFPRLSWRFELQMPRIELTSQVSCGHRNPDVLDPGERHAFRLEWFLRPAEGSSLPRTPSKSY